MPINMHIFVKFEQFVCMLVFVQEAQKNNIFSYFRSSACNPFRFYTEGFKTFVYFVGNE